MEDSIRASFHAVSCIAVASLAVMVDSMVLLHLTSFNCRNRTIMSLCPQTPLEPLQSTFLQDPL